MGKNLIILIATLVVFCLVTSTDFAHAQQRSNRYTSRYRSQQSQPTTSPYLNLLGAGRGGRTLFNYYRRVLPEQEFRSNDARLGSSIQGLQQQINQQRLLLQTPSSQLSPTGHTTFFLNYGGYFQMGPRQ